MKIIVPMAGIGKRMRPHTLTVPKPLIPIVGKPIVQRLVEDITSVVKEDIEEVAFIIGDFGKEVENKLHEVASNLGTKAKIYYQEEALGTAHAILCAADSLDGEVIIGFADTLFIADFSLDKSQDGIIWVQKVEDPSAFGVIKLDEEGYISDFVEKPSTFVSDQAIIGIYYIKDGKALKSELQYLIDNDLKEKGEYQLTNALEALKAKGAKFVPGEVKEWLDCGKKTSTVDTHRRYIQHAGNRENLISEKAMINNSTIIPPVYIGGGAEITSSVIGPHVSIGKNTKIQGSIISNSIIQAETEIEGFNCEGSMIGNKCKIRGKAHNISLGDYNELEV